MPLLAGALSEPTEEWASVSPERFKWFGVVIAVLPGS
jgi:hypothetical protein